MSVLFTGNLSNLSLEFYNRITPTEKCVLFFDKDAKHYREKNLVTYVKNKNVEDDIMHIFSTFDFSTVVYVSSTIDGNIKVFDELEHLESILYACRKYKVSHFIYITSNDLIGYDSDKVDLVSRAALMSACENMCKEFALERICHFKILKIPYLYNLKENNNRLTHYIERAIVKGKIIFRGTKNKQIDFLCDEDLGELINRTLDEVGFEYMEELYVSGENPMLLADFLSILKEYNVNPDYEFENLNDCIPGYHKNTLARDNYGWYPSHNFNEDISLLINRIKSENITKKHTSHFKEKYSEFRNFIRIGLEMIVCFAISIFLNGRIENNVLLNFLDFRLIFVIIMGTMNGLLAGTIAALLASISHLTNSLNNTHWQIIFYNVENWLPFAVYFLLGSLCGYNHDKHINDNNNLLEEKKVIENKYIYLSDLYENAIDSKEQYNNQIVGYKDSFGKIATIVKKLDTTNPNQVFLSAIDILEDILSNDSVAIYLIDKGNDFARLTICSKNAMKYVGDSVDLSEYPKLKECLMQNKVFVNINCMLDYPQYVAPIMHGDELLGMISLLNTKDSQMNMEFSNKFSIIAELISNSLVRAMALFSYENKYYENTLALNSYYFRDLLRLKSEMKKKQYVKFLLFKVISSKDDLLTTARNAGKIIRFGDAVGLLEDGFLYIYMAQTDYRNIDRIRERLRGYGLELELADENMILQGVV